MANIICRRVLGTIGSVKSTGMLEAGTCFNCLCGLMYDTCGNFCCQINEPYNLKKENKQRKIKKGDEVRYVETNPFKTDFVPTLVPIKFIEC